MWFLLVFEEKKVRECVRKKVDFKLSELEGEHNWVWRNKTIARTRCSNQKVELSSSWTIKFCFCCCLFLLSATGCSSSATKTITSSGAIKHTTSTHKHSREDRGGTVIVSVWRKWTQNRNNPAVTSWRSSSYRRSCQNTHTRCTSGVCVWGWGRRLKSVNTPRLNTDRQWLFSYQHLCPQANKHSHAHLLTGVNSARSEHRRCIIEWILGCWTAHERERESEAIKEERRRKQKVLPYRIAHTRAHTHGHRW